MPKEIVDVEIDVATGKMKVKCKGFVGDGCKVIEKAEKALAFKNNIKTKPNDEAYQYRLRTPATAGIA